MITNPTNLADLTTGELMIELRERQARNAERAEREAGRDIGAERTASARAAWDALPALPPAEQIAAPIVAALAGLVDVFADRGEFLAWPVGEGLMADEAAELMSTADAVARIVSRSVGATHASAVDALLRRMIGLVAVTQAHAAASH